MTHPAEHEQITITLTPKDRVAVFVPISEVVYLQGVRFAAILAAVFHALELVGAPTLPLI
jgi:hypothetical protein